MFKKSEMAYHIQILNYQIEILNILIAKKKLQDRSVA